MAESVAESDIDLRGDSVDAAFVSEATATTSRLKPDAMLPAAMDEAAVNETAPAAEDAATEPMPLDVPPQSLISRLDPDREIADAMVDAGAVLEEMVLPRAVVWLLEMEAL